MAKDGENKRVNYAKMRHPPDEKIKALLSFRVTLQPVCVQFSAAHFRDLQVFAVLAALVHTLHIAM